MLVALLVLPLAARAQVPQELTQLLTGEPVTDEAPAEDLTIDERIAALTERLEAARARLAEAEAAEPAILAMQYGVAPEAVTAWLRDLRRTALMYDRHIDELARWRDLQATAEEARTARDNWPGFEEEPPYTVAFLDALRDEAYAAQLELESAELEVEVLEGELADRREALEEARISARQAREAAAAGEEATPSELFAIQAAEARVRYQEAAVERVRTALERSEAARGLYEERLRFANRRVALAAPHVPFSPGELEAVTAGLADRQAALTREVEEAEARREAAQQALAAAQEAVGAARAAAETAANGVAPADAASLALQAETAAVEAETARIRLQFLKALLAGLEEEERIWQERFTVYRDPEPAQLREDLQRIRFEEAEVDEWDRVISTSLETTRTRTLATREMLDREGADDATRRAARARLASYDERAETLQRAAAAVTRHGALLRHWGDDVATRLEAFTLWDQVGSALARVGSFIVTDMWSVELMAIDEESVTVRKVLVGLLILILGAVVAWQASRLFRAVAIQRFKAQESLAASLQKMLFYLLLLAVAVFALNTVAIPITVFAFLGGALAIGVGFGAQNLINNFISGLIILMERPIKLGDIVDIDGVRGRVVNIGARCSQVKLFDGVDILVPNSSFLEKNVTNWTLADQVLRFQVSVGVAYGSPTREVSRLIMKAVEEHGKILGMPEPRVIFEDFGDNALLFTAYFWLEVTRMMDYRIVASDLRHRIDRLFAEAGITIAFPQRDVHLDSLSPIQVEVLRRGDVADEPPPSGGPAGPLP